MAKGLFDSILDSIFDEEWVGRRGEKLTERELKLVKLLGRKGKTLRNVYLPKDDGGTSEIDVMYITQKGIFVFESKNYSGWIFGDEKGQYWTAMLPSKQKNRFYNPIRQNRTHLKWLAKYVGEMVPLFSIIVFSERCELKKVAVESSDIKVIKRDRTYATVREIWDSVPDALSDEHVEQVHARLKPLTNVDAAVKAAHIESIETRYKQKAAVEPGAKEILIDGKTEQAFLGTPQQEPLQLLCPRCGQELVLRTAKKGENAGNQFYGCSGFPKCRYVQRFQK